MFRPMLAGGFLMRFLCEADIFVLSCRVPYSFGIV